MILRAPLKNPLNTQVWLDWFAQLGFQLEGDWGKRTIKTVLSGFSTQPDQKIISLGKDAFVYKLTVENVNLSSAVVALPFSVEKSIVRVYDGSTLLETLEVEGSSFALSDNTGVDLSIQETFIRG